MPTNPSITELKIPFSRLVEEVREGISISDPRSPGNPLIYINKGFTGLTGYAASEVLGSNCRFLQGPATDPRAVHQMREAMHEKRSCVVELLNYRADGSPFWNNVSITPLFDEAGELLYFAGVQMDVSERRMREERERIFVDNLSHELKTPLAAQIGIVETLQLQSALSEEKRNALYGRLRGQTIRLIQTVEDILTLSSLDSAAGPQKLPLDLREPAQAAFDINEPAASMSGVSLSIELPAEPLTVQADSNELCMLISNLLSNAVHYNRPDGSASLWLSREGQEAVIRVSDSGIGIAPEHQARIFERFYRADKGRSRLRGGSGLGLSIVKSIVQGCGGSISVQSRIDEGSVFTVRLPLA